MACGLEVRAPFLDAELVDCGPAASRLVQVRPQPDQAVAQAAAAGPAPGVDPEPAQEGLRHPGGPLAPRPLAPLLDRLLDPRRLKRQGLFRPDEVARRIGEHRSGVRDHRKPLWTLLMFQLWYDTLADGSP